MGKLRHASRRPQTGGLAGIAPIPFGNFLLFSPFSCHLSVGARHRSRLDSEQARGPGFCRRGFLCPGSWESSLAHPFATFSGSLACASPAHGLLHRPLRGLPTPLMGTTMMNNDLFRHAASSSLGAALMLALAACGSGDGGAPAAQQPADGGAVVKAEVASGEATQGAQPSQAQNDAPAAQTNAAQAGAANDAASSDEPKTMTEPIEGGRIRGDVLATALTQEITVPAQNGEGDGQQTQVLMWNTYGVVPEGGIDSIAFLYERTVRVGSAGNSLGTIVHDSRTWLAHPEKAARGWDAVRVQLGFSGQEQVPLDLTRGSADQEVLRINRIALVERQKRGAKQQYNETLSSQSVAEAERGIRKNEAIHSGQLMTWKHDSFTGTEVSLHIGVPSDVSERQFSICLTASTDWHNKDGRPDKDGQADEVRDTCSKWEVPQNWQAGDKLIYKGQSMEEQKWHWTFIRMGDDTDIPYRFSDDDTHGWDSNKVPSR